MIYNFLLVIFIIASLPKMIWHQCRHHKRLPSLKDRLGMDPPAATPTAEKRIWIHAVSLGEIKAARPLFEELIQIDPLPQMLITTSTATGYDQAVRFFENRAEVRYFPLDFTWIMRRWIHSFRPTQLIFVEGDLWPNLLSVARRMHVKTALVSGKISEKSARRFRFFRFAARHIFGSLDLLCVQNEEYRDRLAPLVNNPVRISGNLKLDIQSEHVNSGEVRRRFSLSDNQLAITISSTHAPEEKDLLAILLPLWERIPELVVFLAPRHPERFDAVAFDLCQMKESFCRWNQLRIRESIVLVDAMGQLPLCYSVSSIAIVAGSFASRKGGHNILEPCLYGCPVLFGPYMHAQKELVKAVLEAGAGRQVGVKQIASTVLECFDSLPDLRANALRLIERNRGSTDRTIQILKEMEEQIDLPL
jgi:3-deoxy-D-manno-octulosonic-acid transferase